MHITKKFQSAAQSSGHVKIFCSEQKQVRAAVKKIRGNVVCQKYISVCRIRSYSATECKSVCPS
jgi:hypothetical protein